MWIASQKNAKELAASLIKEIESSVVNRTRDYFLSAEHTNHSSSFFLYRYFQDVIGVPDDTEKLFDYYTNMLNMYPQFNMLYYSDTYGNLIMLNRMADGTFSRRYVNNDGETIRIQWNHVTPSYQGSYPNTQESADQGYDPRSRIWYTMAAEQKGVIWTPVYLFATNHLPGFTCAAPIYNSDGSLVGISCVDIAVADLSLFLGTIQPTPGIKIVILDNQNNLIAIQAKTRADLDLLFTKTDDKTRTGYTEYTINSLDTLSDPERVLLDETIRRGSGIHILTYNNKSYETIISPLSIGSGLDLNIGIIIPDEDVIGNVQRNLVQVTLFSIAMLIVIIIASFFLSNAIASPLRMLSEAMSKIKTLELDADVDINTNLLEILDIRDSFDNMKSGLKNFKRYVPSDLVGQLIKEQVIADVGGEERELTMFFSDISRFTSISEKMLPETLVKDISVYFELISKTIINNKGTIDKYIGDSVMAFWGAPVRMADHAKHACESAILVKNNLAALFRQWDNVGKAAFHTRIGIHTGIVTVGNMGYSERLNYTVIGDAVNVASRLEGINKIYGTDIIVSEDTYRQCKHDFEFRYLDKVSVMGREESLDIYELYSIKNDIEKTLKKLFTYYETGLKYYFNKEFTEAYKYFTVVMKNRMDDTPSKVMRERCIRYMKAPPPKDWSGIYIQRSK
jgi:adenylate cyclase